MEGNQFPTNSKSGPPRAKAETPAPEEKKIERVVTGKVVKRKKSVGTKFKQIFISGPDSRSALSYVWEDILVPASKELFLESINAGLEQRLYGEIRGGRRVVGGRRGGSRTEYHRMSGGIASRDPMRPPVREDPRLSSRARRSHDFGEILIENRVEAVAVIDQMFELLSRFEVVTVADMYDILGETSDFVDRRWGWTDLRGSDVQYTRDGYLLVLPPTVALD